MRRYLDCIAVHNSDLAYTIIEALEKNDDYSIDLFDEANNPESMTRRGDGSSIIELRVFRNEKVVPAPPIGFGQEEKDD